ncbi:MAG: M1 family metallopeptidase [Acidimicrobiia bacterium]|nr:M1 family metallopeptidase [Acidimicrobiia bacterium]
MIASDTPDPYRLPREVIPQQYVLRLTPNLESFTFTGEVSVDILVTEPVNRIMLNAAELKITSAKVGSSTISDIQYDPDHERVTLELADRLEPCMSQLNLCFSGTLNENLHGFYRSVFTDSEDNQRVIATTQFEPTNARRAFPCWDEPDLKATFEVTLTVPEHLMAISSGAETSSQQLGNGLKEVRFAPTIKMSTYLLAFVIGPLETTNPTWVNGTPVRIIHPLGKGHLTAFALEAAVFCLNFFEDYFDIAYPGDKLDLVAIPDFAFGAMENMGCVTFREALLLIDPATSTQQERQSAADVIAHELAHMWFGNLVTMQWWNGIWLKEALATFCEMLAVDAFRPDWQRWLTFGLSRTAAFEVDALTTTRAIEYPVISPQDAEGMYDLLTYQKGAATIRMLEQFLGAEKFRNAVQSYLRQHSYSNTETHHLWDALTAATGQPARNVMDSWIFQGGHPLITATADADHKVTLRQQRFSYSPQTEQASWQVPIIVAAADNHIEHLVLGEQAELRATAENWVMLNPNADGFYRVSYQNNLLTRLLQDGPQLNPLQRFMLLDDQWALTVAKQLPLTEYLQLAAHIAISEDNLAVWQRLTNTLSTLDHLSNNQGREALRQQTRNMIGPTYRRLGWEQTLQEDERTNELRGVLVCSLATTGNDQNVIARCRQLFNADATNPALDAAATTVVATTGNAADYEKIHRRLADAPTPQLQLRYLTALSLFTQPELMDRTLAATLDGTIRSQDAGFVIRDCLRNRERGVQAWRFVTQRWDEINQKIPSQIIPRMLEGICALSTAQLASEITAFLKAHPVSQGPLIVAQHLERLQVNVQLRQRVAQTLISSNHSP